MPEIPERAALRECVRGKGEEGRREEKRECPQSASQKTPAVLRECGDVVAQASVASSSTEVSERSELLFDASVASTCEAASAASHQDSRVAR